MLRIHAIPTVPIGTGDARWEGMLPTGICLAYTVNLLSLIITALWDTTLYCISVILFSILLIKHYCLGIQLTGE